MTDHVQPSAITPVESPRGCLSIGLLTLGRLLVHVAALLVVLVVLCSGFFGFPGVWRYFEQQHILVPTNTQQVYGAYRWLMMYWFIAIPAFLASDAMLLMWLESRPRSIRWLARVWFATVLLGALLAVAYINVAIVVPFAPLAPIEGVEPVPAEVE